MTDCYRLCIPATGEITVVKTPAVTSGRQPLVFATPTSHPTREAAEAELDQVLTWWDAA